MSRIKSDITGVNFVERRLESNNPHAVIIGTDKKRNHEIVTEQIHDILTNREDNVIIIDPDGRYKDLVKKYDGQLIKFGTGYCINPFDVSKFKREEFDEQLFHIEDIMIAFCEIVKKSELNAVEKLLICTCVDELYKDENNIPLLQNFCDELEKNPITTASNDKIHKTLVESLIPHVNGIYDMFANETNIKHEKRLVVYDLSTLPAELVTLSALVIFHFVSEIYIFPQIKVNKGVRNWLFVDKLDLLLNEPKAASIVCRNFKRFRMYYGVFTGIMTDCTFTNSEACTIVSCSNYIHVTKISKSKKQEYKEIFDIEGVDWKSDEEMVYFANGRYGDIYIIKTKNGED